MELPDFFGLDIGNHTIRLAQILRRGEDAVLEQISEIEIQANLINNASEQALEELSAKIKLIREQSGIRTVNCVMGIPEAPVFSRLVTIPEIEDAQIQETVHWELKPLIPVPLTEVDIAFLEISRRQMGTQKLIDIFVVAAPRSLTERYKKLAEMAGINLIALETEALANTRLVNYIYPSDNQDIIILDFGASGTDIVVSRGGVPVFTQSLSTGSDALTKAIAADYDIDLEQAEKYKRAYGLDTTQGEGKIAASLMPVMKLLLTELQRTLTYFREKMPESKVSTIYLCGQASKLTGLPQYLQQNLGLQPIIVEPFSKIQLANEQVKTFVQQGSVGGFSVSLGLALKDR